METGPGSPEFHGIVIHVVNIGKDLTWRLLARNAECSTHPTISDDADIDPSTQPSTLAGSVGPLLIVLG
jgi:hypothetical protein